MPVRNDFKFREICGRWRFEVFPAGKFANLCLSSKRERVEVD
jgi:hypothetical protein